MNGMGMGDGMAMMMKPKLEGKYCTLGYAHYNDHVWLIKELLKCVVFAGFTTCKFLI